MVIGINNTWLHDLYWIDHRILYPNCDFDFCDCCSLVQVCEARRRKIQSSSGWSTAKNVAFKEVKHYEGTPGVDQHFLSADNQASATTPIQGVADLISVYQGSISHFCDQSGDTRFYHKPLPNGSDGFPRFGKQPMGRNTLAKIISELTQTAGFTGTFTSHTPRASWATQLYHQGVDEQLIMERTGHRSVEAARSYKRTSDSLVKSVSIALEPAAKRIPLESSNLPIPASNTQSTEDAKPSPSSIRTGKENACQQFLNCNVNIYMK